MTTARTSPARPRPAASPIRKLTPIVDLSATAYRIPTDAPEADASAIWSSTTIVVAFVEAGGMQGLGYTYADAAAAPLIATTLADAAHGLDAFDIPACLAAMRRAACGLGRAGLAAMAVSAVDAALWDLKAKLLDLPLSALLGAAHEAVPVHGSGGFTCYADSRLSEQLAEWVKAGCRAVTMRVGADPGRDPARLAAARAAIGDAGLFADAAGVFDPRQALRFAEMADRHGVRRFEEPVAADDIAGLRLLRERAPAGLDIAAGRHGCALADARRLLAVGAVDALVADASRCGGISGFLAAGALCDAYHVPLSGHGAPALHLHAACALPCLRQLEWFHDHVRVERMLFDGAPMLQDGMIRPDPSRPGLGLELKAEDAARYEIG